MKHILFNFATKSRPARFYDVVDTIMSLCSQPDYTIVVKVDRDDPEEKVYDHTDVKMVWRWGTSESKIHAINRDIPLTVWGIEWDILVNVSDDIIFTVKGFDDIIREHTGPDDFVLFPEPFVETQVVKGYNERISVMSVMGREYYKRDGYVYHPAYKSLFCDNEATQVARERGRLKEVEIPIFYHAHPAAGYNTNDEQYKRTEAFYHEDKATFIKRKAEGWPV